MQQQDRRWLVTAIAAAAAYVVIGLGTTALSHAAADAGLLRAERLASWLVSAAVFAIHLFVERRTMPASRSAWHTTVAVMLATLVIAAVATVRQTEMGHYRLDVGLALAIWPVLTGIVSFLVALVIQSAGRAMLRSRSTPS